MDLKFPKFVFTILLSAGLAGVAPGQDPVFVRDSLIIPQDTVSVDTLAQVSDDSETEAIDAPIDYQADDSLNLNIIEEKVYLYGNAVVTYQDIELRAAYIELDMTNDEVFASGVIDSLGREVGKPVFKEGSESFESKTLTYNFKTKKGVIRSVVTEQEGGYLHSGITK
ncbi:MAG: hypothetical protein JSV24_02830, partial [Bacteroidales bacterium]